MTNDNIDYKAHGFRDTGFGCTVRATEISVWIVQSVGAQPFGGAIMYQSAKEPENMQTIKVNIQKVPQFQIKNWHIMTFAALAIFVLSLLVLSRAPMGETPEHKAAVAEAAEQVAQRVAFDTAHRAEIEAVNAARPTEPVYQGRDDSSYGALFGLVCTVFVAIVLLRGFDVIAGR